MSMTKVTQAALTLSLVDSSSILITWDPVGGFSATTKPPVTGSVVTSGSTGSTTGTTTTSGSTTTTTGSTSTTTGSVTQTSGSTTTTSGSTSTTTTSGSSITAYTGFAKTGKVTAPLSGSGVLTPAEPPASTQPQGQTYSIPAAVMPTTAGQTYVDPVFGTTIRRLPTGMRHAYSQLQAFSDDDTLMITVIPNGGYHVIKYPSMQEVTPPNFGTCISPRWLPNSHKIITTDYGWATGGAFLNNVVIRLWDIDAGTVKTLYTLPFTACNSNHAFEQLSWDGQWTSLYAQDTTGAWRAVAVNLVTGQLGANLPDANFAALDWVGVSPLGNYLMVNSNGTSNGSSPTGFGLELYDIKTGAFVRRLYNADYHLDHGLNQAGAEGVLTVTLASLYNNNNPGIVTYNMATGAMSQLRQVTWAASPDHMSMQGPPGLYVLDSGWSNNSTGLQPFEGEIYALYSDGSTRRLAHHRCNPSLLTDPTMSYFCQAQATMSKSGKLVAFCTNWNTAGQNPQGFVIENLVL